MNRIISVALLTALLVLSASGSCPAPSPIIASSSLGSIFNKTIALTNYKPSLYALIDAPDFAAINTYGMSFAPFVLPLWCLGGVTLLMLIGCFIQLCCYNCCNQKSCGTKISVKSYRPCLLSCMVYSFMVISILLIAASILSFILSSDFLTQTNYTICSVNNTLSNLFIGTPPGTSPSWSGVDNFNYFSNEISVNFPNAMPSLAAIFTSATYTDTTSNTTGSSFNNAVAPYNCPSALASNTVTCPFPSLASCANSSNSQIPLFSQQYCNATNPQSAAAQIKNEQTTNSTSWHTSLVNLSALVNTYATTPPDFTQMVSQSSQLQAGITQYQPQLQSGIQAAFDNFYYAEIGFYAVLGFFILMGLLSFLAILCVYCARNFNCRYLLYPLWILFALLATIFFIISGVMVLGTFVAYDSCALYGQLTTNQTALTSLPYYSSSQAVQVLDSCFYPQPNSSDTIFDAFSHQNQAQIQQLKNLYTSALPAPTFTSVSQNIFNLLVTYSANPNSLKLVTATTAQNPQAALDSANAFASNGGSASCSAVKDTLQYNPDYCYPLLLNQPAGSPSCVLIANTSNALVAARQTSFTSHNCSAGFTTYNNNFAALNTFGNSVHDLIASYLSDSALSTYTTNYFNYYQQVNTLMNSYTQSLFKSFLGPYNALIGGSSCSYLTGVLNSLVNNTCNNNFPYIYALTVLTIIITCFFFLLTILSYFLTVRMEFYAYLSGDLGNYDEHAGSTQSIQIQMADQSTSNRTKLLETEPSPPYREIQMVNYNRPPPPRPTDYNRPPPPPRQTDPRINARPPVRPPPPPAYYDDYEPYRYDNDPYRGRSPPPPPPQPRPTNGNRSQSPLRR